MRGALSSLLVKWLSIVVQPFLKLCRSADHALLNLVVIVFNATLVNQGVKGTQWQCNGHAIGEIYLHNVWRRRHQMVVPQNCDPRYGIRKRSYDCFLNNASAHESPTYKHLRRSIKSVWRFRLPSPGELESDIPSPISMRTVMQPLDETAWGWFAN
ncbi:unnamed protein product [Linum trigynum]|uniref:Secreted protein n=1 Tax=Linum trigynum TaxID=586398 RepID=A0AAV2CU76_9ROSI